MRFAVVALLVVSVSSAAIATDCFVPVQQVKQFVTVPQYQAVQKVQFAQKLVAVQQYAVGYQYHAPVLFSVGSHYRSHRAEAVDAGDIELLKRFRAYLEAEKAIAESRAAGVLESSCVACHNATKSGGGYVFDGSVSLDSGAKSAMMRAVLSGSMPPSGRLTDDEMAELADQLFLEKW